MPVALSLYLTAMSNAQSPIGFTAGGGSSLPPRLPDGRGAGLPAPLAADRGRLPVCLPEQFPDAGPHYLTGRRRPHPGSCADPTLAVIAWCEDLASYLAWRRWCATGQAASLDDLTGAALAGLAHAIDTFDPARAGFGTWAQGCIERALLQHARREDHLTRAQRREIEPLPAPLSLDELDDQLPDPADGPDARLLDQAARRALWTAVETLPREQAEPVALHLRCGWTFARIGARLGIPASTAYWRYRRGLTLLRALVPRDALGCR